MKHYTDIIPLELAKKLKEAGYWNPGCTITSQYNNACYFKDGRFYEGVIADWKDLFPAPSFAEVFDWLMERGINIRIESDWEFDNRDELDIVTSLATDFFVEKVGKSPIFVDVKGWHEAADAAITKALGLI